MSNIVPFYPVVPAQPVEPEYPTSCRRVAALGWSVIALTLGGLGAWSVLAPLGAAAIAPGTVVVDSQRKSIQHLEGGVIREIRVRDGDVVAAGDVLLRLDGMRVRVALASLQPLLETNRAEKARLTAERDGLDIVSFSEDLAAAPPDSITGQILARQERLFRVRREAIEGETAILNNRLAQTEDHLAGLRRQIASKGEQIALVREELAGLEDLFRKGYAARKQVFSARRALGQLESEHADLEARREESRKSIDYYRLEREQLRMSFLEGVESELQALEKEAYDILERSRAIGDEHERLDVRAPVAGVVVNLAAHTVGGVIAPGSRILDIVPKDDRLVIEAQIRTMDIDGVRVGLPADVYFPAFGRTDMPRLRGLVTLVSADRLVNPTNGAPYFLARVLVDEREMGRLPGVELVPGMPAEVMINKGTRTLLGYLLSPVTGVALRAFRE